MGDFVVFILSSEKFSFDFEHFENSIID